jgi:hypothetical protein
MSFIVYLISSIVLSFFASAPTLLLGSISIIAIIIYVWLYSHFLYLRVTLSHRA